MTPKRTWFRPELLYLSSASNHPKERLKLRLARLARGLLFLSILLQNHHAFAASSLVLQPKIDPHVLEDTLGERKGSFLVLLSEQTDTHLIAKTTPERRARRAAAVVALRETAGRTQPAIQALLRSNQASYRSYWIANVLAVEGDRTLVEALSRRGDILAIESDRTFAITNEEPQAQAAAGAGPGASAEPNIALIGAPDLWLKGVRGEGIVYANADSGVQWNHPALLPHYRGWDGTNADHNYNWWDAIHNAINNNGSHPCGFNSPVPCDDSGHGTHTLGIAVGDDNAGNRIGVAPGAKWIACHNMDANVGRPSTYIECMQFLLAPTDLDGHNPDPDRGADCVGNSYTCPPSELCAADSLRVAMENMRAAGVFMAVAAGNYGPGCATVLEPPSVDDAAITVGATWLNDQIANWSSRGPVTVDGSNRRKPDLVAPGVSVRSALPGNSYIYRNGTSMATPHVAGAVALLWSAFPQLRGQVDDTESVLEQTAVRLTSSQGCGGDSSTQIPNNTFGFGRIDVLAAFNSLTNSLPPVSVALRIVRSGQQVVLSWPSDAAGYALETAAGFPTQTNAWMAITNGSTVIGNEQTFTTDTSGTNRFYRLRHP